MRLLVRRQASIGLLLFFFELGILFSPWPYVRYALSFCVLWLFPGLAWGTYLLRGGVPRQVRWCVALGLNFVFTPLTMLLLNYLSGPISRTQILLTIAAVTIFPGALTVAQLWRRRARGSVSSGEIRDRELDSWLRSHWWLVGLLLCLVVGFRLVNLGYSEFQGDEATVLVRAAKLLEGDSQVIFHHKKGPAEILVVAASWRLTGISNEWMARFPFSWANVLGICAAFLIARYAVSLRAAIAAVPLLAIEGYLLAFGRLTQYQSLVIALGLLSLLCLLWFYTSAAQPVLVVLAAVLMAGAALAHYDAIFVLPPGLLLLAVTLWRERRRPEVWTAVALAGLLGGAVLASFYWPFMAETASGTADYIASRVGSSLRNNLSPVFTLATVYNSVYMLAILALGIWVQAVRAWRAYGWTGIVAVGGLSGWALSVFIRSLGGQYVVPMWAAMPFALLAVGAGISPRQSWPRRALWLWLICPFVFYLFYVATSFTHVQTFLPPAILLTAATVTGVMARVQGRPRAVRWSVVAVGAAAWLVCGYYAVHMFVQHNPEYRRTFPDHKLPLYWTPYEKMPRAGLFGFPYRAGWKAVGYLVETGELNGDYESNEEPSVASYYMRSASRWHCPTPAMYITAKNVQDEIYIRWDQVEAPYNPLALVTVEGEPKIAIQTLDAVGEAAWLPVEAYTWLYDLRTTPERVAPVELEFPEIPTPPTDAVIEMDLRVGEDVRLAGYDLPTTEVTAGSYIPLTLVWEALSPDVPDYAIYTHIQGDGYLWGQLDGLPDCGESSTAAWEPGEPVIDLFRIPVRVDAPPGTYPLRVGLYNRRSLERLPVCKADGAYVGDGAHLADITVVPPQ